ncbi:hypothetical protein BDQ17DRAFT_1332585 [Cyathus striatus]|nr:hypothetical protein BDQ17DRAFT_1332585 [Cyathus striatus]
MRKMKIKMVVIDVDDDDDEGEEGEEVEKGNEDNVAVVEAMDIDSALASEPVPTKEELKGGILRGQAQGNNFTFADNMDESSSMIVDHKGFVYITLSDESPSFNPTLLNAEVPPQAVPAVVNSCLKAVLDSVAKRMPIIKSQNRLIMYFDTEHGIWIIFGHFNDIESTNTVKWTSRMNDMALYLAAISVKDVNFHLARSVGSTFGSSTTSKSSDNVSGSGSVITEDNPDVFEGLTKKQELIISIYKWTTWKIYQEVQQVKNLVETSPQMWPADMDKPITKDLHKMFGAAGTSWHHWDKVLKVISSYQTWKIMGLGEDSRFYSSGLGTLDYEKEKYQCWKGEAEGRGGKTKKGSGLKKNFLYICVWLLGLFYEILVQHYWLLALAYLPMTYENQIPIIVDDDEVISEIAIKLDKFAKFLGLHPYNDDGYFTQELGPISEKKITPNLVTVIH